MKLIDEAFGPHDQGWTLERVYRVNGDADTVRVRIRCDVAYPKQSSAVAEVLTPALTWTPLATAPYTDWAPNSPYYRASGEANGRKAAAFGHKVAEGLATRAAAILDASGR